tara:strand:- start:279 stop:566 length:288 start_codon:yes stop_codon:yes gene_type:complete
MSSFSKSDNIDITPQNRLSVNSLSPTPNTKQYLQHCYGVSWDKIDENKNENKNEKNKRKSLSISSMSPPSINTAKVINSLVGAKVFKQSISGKNI